MFVFLTIYSETGSKAKEIPRDPINRRIGFFKFERSRTKIIANAKLWIRIETTYKTNATLFFLFSIISKKMANIAIETASEHRIPVIASFMPNVNSHKTIDKIRTFPFASLKCVS